MTEKRFNAGDLVECIETSQWDCAFGDGVRLGEIYIVSISRSHMCQLSRLNGELITQDSGVTYWFPNCDFLLASSHQVALHKLKRAALVS
jgi:hypothetical protein